MNINGGTCYKFVKSNETKTIHKILSTHQLPISICAGKYKNEIYIYVGDKPIMDDNALFYDSQKHLSLKLKSKIPKISLITWKFP